VLRLRIYSTGGTPPKTIQEIASDHAIHPIQVSQLLDGASDLFTRGKKSKDKEKAQAKSSLKNPAIPAKMGQPPTL
jgi:hypothetical protein